jgi:NADH-quinone oxidoreductase subunit M
MPRLAAFFLFVALASMGLPMLNGFVGEFLILLGTYQMHANWASWAALGVILSACYLLWAYQRVFFGEVTHDKNKTLPDTSSREKWILGTMVVVTLWMGMGSSFFTRRFAASCQNVLDQMQRQQAQEAAVPAEPAPPTGVTAIALPGLSSAARNLLSQTDRQPRSADSLERSGTR